jgi:hypothetical protein
MTVTDKLAELRAVERLCARLRRELAELRESETTREWLWKQTEADERAFDRATGGAVA